MILYSSTTADTLPAGRSARIVAIHGPHRVVFRLRTLGFRPGATVRALAHAPWRGPILLEVDGCRIALGRALARRILVAPLP